MIELVLNDGSPVSASAHYTSLSQMENKFGKANILIWTDLENADEDTGALTSEGLAKINQVVEKVSRDIDTALENQYHPLPFSTVPATIEGIATAIAGFELYTARSSYEENAQVFKANEDAVQHLDDIKRGTRRLPYPRVKHVPVTDLTKLRSTRNAN